MREDRQSLAARTSLFEQDDGDPNALVPIGVEIALTDGSRLSTEVRHVYGSPENPMTRDAHLAKFRQNCLDGRHPLSPAEINGLIDACDTLHGIPDIDALVTAAR